MIVNQTAIFSVSINGRKCIWYLNLICKILLTFFDQIMFPGTTMTYPSDMFHCFLRPCVIQILRGTGFHAAKPSVVDYLTELASVYLWRLCQSAAENSTTHSAKPIPSTIDILDALEEWRYVRHFENSENNRQDKDSSGNAIAIAEELAIWLSGTQHAEIYRVASDDEDTYTDYLSGIWFFCLKFSLLSGFVLVICTNLLFDII